MRFQVVNLDPPSQMLYNSLNSKHMSGETVSALLNSAGQDLTNNVQGKFVSLKVSALLFDLRTTLDHLHSKPMQNENCTNLIYLARQLCVCCVLLGVLWVLDWKFTLP